MKLSGYKYLSHGYMLFSLLSVIMLFIKPKIAWYLSYVGASSGYITLGLASAETLGSFAGAFCCLYMIIFPISLIVTYILTIRKRYVPFCVTVAIDAIAATIWTIYAVTSGNLYGFQHSVPDAIISDIIAGLLCWFTYKTRYNTSTENSSAS